MVRKFIPIIAILALLSFNVAHASITLTPINAGDGNGFVSFGGVYWGYSSVLGSEIEVSSSYFSCSGANDEYYIAWNSSVGLYQNIVAYTTSYIKIDTNGGSFSTTSFCNQGYAVVNQQTIGGITYPQTAFSTDASGNNYLYHTYSVTGEYQPQAGDEHTYSNIPTIYIYSAPTISGYSATETSFDLGSTSTLTGTVNCGSNTECANVSLTGATGFGQVSSPYSLNYAYIPASSGQATISLCSYDPIQASSQCANKNFNIYPVLKTPTPSFTANQFTTLSYSYTIKVPKQVAGSSTEGNPSGTINFNDGNGAQALSFSVSGGNYTATISHTFSTAGTYNAVINLQSYNYVNEGSSYGSASSNSFSVSVATYNPPSFNGISPTNVLELKPTTFTVNIIQGNYLIKNTTISWGDGSSNTIITSNSLTVNAIHTYPYVASPNPNTFSGSVVICDINSACVATPVSIVGSYTLANVISIMPSNTYSIITTPFTFNIILGNYLVKSLQVNWGDGSPLTILSINSLTPAFNHTYSTGGTFKITATAIDNNSVPSTAFAQNVLVNAYIYPKISELAPQSVIAGNAVIFSFNLVQGTSPFASVNAVVINFGSGGSAYLSNVVAGINHVSFEYNAIGNFSAVERVTDTKSLSSTNVTLIQVSNYPWSFTTPQPIINYNATNSSATALPIFVQTNNTDILSISYTVQQDNVANNYICNTQVSSKGLFFVSCYTNPSAISYSNQTLYATIYAKDTSGTTKSVTEQINIFTKVKPTPIATPYNANVVVNSPVANGAFIRLNWESISLIIVIIFVVCCAGWYFIFFRETEKPDEEE